MALRGQIQELQLQEENQQTLLQAQNESKNSIK
jgi:hypothetical protein